jgi:CCR4-NOT complex subunit CAF16
MTTINISNLDFSYDRRNNILNNINLQVDEREFVLLVGENGAGKSTLLRIISGMHLVQNYNSFKILGNSSPNDQFNGLAYLGNTWKKNVGYIGNLNYCCDIKVCDLMKKNQNKYSERRDELVKLLNINLNWKMHEVSEGERKKVQIMLALLKPFKLLLIDEFTNELDVVVRDNLFKYLKNECTTNNASIIYATHIFDNLEKYITNVVFICNKTCHNKKTLNEFILEDNLYNSVKNKIINNKNLQSINNKIDKHLLGPQGGWSSGRSQNIC